MQNLTQALWTIHPKPLDDELLSSWLVRIAHMHGLKVETFCHLKFGKERPLWNRDIDRLSPDWLITEICSHTGLSTEAGQATTLRAYEHILYPHFHSAGLLRWILPLKMYHRTRNGFGMQFCPACLAQDSEPYYRRRWRVGFNVFCPTHNCMLHERCPRCEAPIIFHRLELGRPDIVDVGPLSTCFKCGLDLRDTVTEAPEPYDRIAYQVLERAIASLDAPADHNGTSINIGFLSVLHQLCKLMTSRYKSAALRKHITNELRIDDIPLADLRLPFILRPLHERWHLLQLAAWIMASPELRLTAAWRAKTIRYNHLEKDFTDPPAWYSTIVNEFSDWRVAK
ncbi:TniQ family protein [Chitinibacter sp. ZOR0017]|uniref:TniQ family protein n=1 Tax=Chitinibacter sp. ZOR0017 TaxID=1339254 RepID=UPI0009DE5A1C|nr:TniQ family protein [Chitinibacter sp. ZOR0017]